MPKLKLHQKLYRFLASKQFFYVIVGLFLVHALWLAFTSLYPMAFDENYHYGIIQQYAQQWGPFFSTPPAGSEALGDITRYPSYLFHYLMSFPYRVISLFIESDAIKILSLRVLNIAMLASSLWIFKRIFEAAKLSKPLGNVVLLIFVMVPVVPFLGAQISYDNASIPLTALTVLLAVQIIAKLRARMLDTNLLLFFGLVGTFTSLIKYTYLPILVVTSFYIFVALLYYCRKYKLKVFKPIRDNLQLLTPLKRWLLLIFLLLGIGLCIERYGVNLAVYRTPVPDCGQILTESSCKQYGPWGRDLRLKQRRKHEVPQWKIKDYNKVWTRTTMEEFFFAIDHKYQPQPPLVVIYKFAHIMIRVGLVIAVLFIWKLFKDPYLRFFSILFASYVVVVWLDNFSKFYTVHWPVAIHGRYLLPLLPLAFIVLGYGIKYLLDYVPRISQQLKLMVALVCMIFMLYGGGAATYIMRSNQAWYWQNPVVIRTNNGLRQLLSPIIK